MGTPTILIQKGKILKKNLKKVKFDVNDLLEECRSKNYFDLKEIEYALMESKGTLSILPKDEYKIITKKRYEFTNKKTKSSRKYYNR